MITLYWYDNEFTCDVAVRGEDYVVLYDNDYNETNRIINIIGQEWNHINIEGGEWSDPSIIPTVEDYLRADIDFLTMENEDLTEQAEQARADIDYLLMLSDEEPVEELIEETIEQPVEKETTDEIGNNQQEDEHLLNEEDI